MLDLLGGMRKQGILYAKSNTPAQTSDMLHVMALCQPFSGDRLVGFDVAWLFSGDGGHRGGGKSAGSVAADVLLRGERYYLRGVSELSRLRLEAGAPVSRDVTRREAEVRCWYNRVAVMMLTCSWILSRALIGMAFCCGMVMVGVVTTS